MESECLSLLIGPGVLTALLGEYSASCPSEQLRVLFCGDPVIQPDADSSPGSTQAAQVQTATSSQCCMPSLRIVILKIFAPKHLTFSKVCVLTPQNFSAQLGEMRQRFGMFDSPLNIALVTSRGGRDSCSSALLTLRSLGVSADEAYCLAGAPRSPILSLLRPHFLLSSSFSSL